MANAAAIDDSKIYEMIANDDVDGMEAYLQQIEAGEVMDGPDSPDLMDEIQRDSEAKQPEQEPDGAGAEGNATNSESETANAEGGTDEIEGTDSTVMAKDGVHQIPYEVLERERLQNREKDEIIARLEAEKNAISESKARQNDTPDFEEVDEDTLDSWEEDYGEQGRVMRKNYEDNQRLRQTIEAMAQKQAQREQAEQQSVLETERTALKKDVEATPEMAAWWERPDSQERFKFAHNIDEMLSKDPAWAGKPRTQRFSEVARRTNAAFGDTVAQRPASAGEQTTGNAAPNSPDSMGGMVSGTSVAGKSKSERLAQAEGLELEAMLDEMTPEEIEAVIMP